jgi:lysozyme family protein
MSQSTTQQRVAWKAYECNADRMQVIPFGPDRIRVANPTVDAWRALESVMQAHDYRIRPSDTDSYNCRQITGGTGKSLHAYGIALDVNWTTNPFRATPDRRKVRFSNKPTQAERALEVKQLIADTDMTPQLIADVLAIKTTDGKRVFEWGGNWSTAKDTMHFELDLTPDELASGIDWSSVKAPAAPAPDLVAAAGEPKPQRPGVNGPQPQSPGASAALPGDVVLGGFDAAQPLIEKWEGGFSNDPRDPGGATNMGITQETLARWRGRPVTVDDVRALTRDEARQIFREFYWKPLRGDELPLPIAQLAYNTAVLSGLDRAVRVLQTALNRQGKPAAIDGEIGTRTIAHAMTADRRRLVDDYAEIYEAYLRGLPAFATFGRGWLNRLAEVRDTARLTGALVAASPETEVSPQTQAGAQTQTDQGGASSATETTMTREEILKMIVAAMNANRPDTQPSAAGTTDATGRATPAPAPQPAPTAPAQPASVPADTFARILTTVLGSIIPQIAAQAQIRPQTAAELAVETPISTTAQAPALRAASIETPSQPVFPVAAADTAREPVFPAAPTDLALGTTIGAALAGRKTVLAMAAYAAATALKTYNPALGATIDTIMPVIYALGGWGALGKLDKWVGALAKKPTEVLATPAAVDVKLP